MWLKFLCFVLIYKKHYLSNNIILFIKTEKCLLLIKKGSIVYNQENKIPKKEIESRIKKFQAYLIKNNIDAGLVLQNTDLYYFTGTIQQSHLYIPAYGEPILMVKKNFKRALSESRIEKIVSFSGLKDFFSILSKEGYPPPKTVGMEFDVITAAMYLNYKKLFDQIKLVDISHFIRLIRSVKSEYEINIIKRACKLSDESVSYALELLKEGVSEIEFAAELEAYMRKLEHQGIVRMRLWGNEMFYGHVLSGETGGIPTYLASPTGGAGLNSATAQGASLKKITKGEPLVVDYVFAYKGYLADQTRILCIGNLSDKLIKAHNTMLDIEALIKKEAKTGVSADYIYNIALQKAKDSGLKDSFMGADSDRVRFVGHGIGLELDEYPFLAKGQKMLLEENMIIAIEPKAIFENIGAVGIENTCLVTKQGLVSLTNSDRNIFKI